jgi:hypothetical protein
MDLEQFIQSVNLKESTKAILSETQDLTGKPFEFRHDPSLPVLASVKIARSSMSNHIVTYSGTDPSALSHQIAHECGHINRYYRAPTERRLVPSSDAKTLQAAIIDIEARDKALLRSFPLEVRYRILPSLVSGLIYQLTNLPTDIYIEKWIFETYPDLRQDQCRSLEKTHREAVEGLNPALRSRLPRVVVDGSGAMNYAFFKKIDQITGSTFLREFRRLPSKKIGESLYKLVRDDDTGLEGDILLVNEWAERLKVTGWFKWIDFEEIPPDYETRKFGS